VRVLCLSIARHRHTLQHTAVIVVDKVNQLIRLNVNQSHTNNAWYTVLYIVLYVIRNHFLFLSKCCVRVCECMILKHKHTLAQVYVVYRNVLSVILYYRIFSRRTNRLDDSSRRTVSHTFLEHCSTHLYVVLFNTIINQVNMTNNPVQYQQDIRVINDYTSLDMLRQAHTCLDKQTSLNLSKYIPQVQTCLDKSRQALTCLDKSRHV
jgi:hypothetical protein